MLLLVLAALAVGVGLAWKRQTEQVAAQQALAAAGERIVTGAQGVSARLRGQEEGLPATAAACVNCHAGATPIGGPLSAASLQDLRSRRGGPASRFDAAALCRLLREGIDPTVILINSAMPIYQISDAQCEAVWAHLITREGTAAR